MRVGVAHDYLTQRGGAERVALHLAREFGGGTIHTALYDRSGTFPEFSKVRVLASPLNHFGFLRRNPYYCLPLLARTWSNTRIDDADVVLASSSGWAHGVQTARGIPKVVYCHNPARWLYQPEDFQAGWIGKAALHILKRRLYDWDRCAAAGASRYIVNSTSVAERVRRIYGIEPTVIHPPYSLDPSGPQSAPRGIEPGYWLTVGRSRGYKNVRMIADAVRSLGGEHRLVVVGANADGVESDRVIFTGRVGDEVLRWLYANARALVAMSKEDFGLTPVEANSFGTPCVALRAGGFLDSLAEGVSGQFVRFAERDELAETLSSFPQFRKDLVLGHAKKFSPDQFSAKLELVLMSAAGNV